MDLTAVTLTELRYVVAVADTGHFGQAASRCHVSQPTLSAQIKKLEDTLGVQLFERAPKRVQVTAIGAEIVERARGMLDELRRIGDLARGQHEPLSGPLRLGVIPTLGPYLLPWLVPPLQKAYPRLRLVLREGLTTTLVDDLLAHRLDVALLALPVGTPGITSVPVFDEPFWVAAPANHPLAKRARLREGDLEAHRVLLLTEGHCLREQALAICGNGRGEGRDADDYRATSLETLRHMVAAGLGCTLLPALALRDRGGPKGLVTKPFRSPAPYRRIGLAWRPSYPGVAAVHALAAFIRERLPAGVRAVKGD
jgi:LysR family hydrogen peroxide-inducible transcriptional activator